MQRGGSQRGNKRTATTRRNRKADRKDKNKITQGKKKKTENKQKLHQQQEGARKALRPDAEDIAKKKEAKAKTETGLCYDILQK